jgi:hypothetical protein
MRNARLNLYTFADIFFYSFVGTPFVLDELSGSSLRVLRDLGASCGECFPRILTAETQKPLRLTQRKTEIATPPFESVPF